MIVEVEGERKNKLENNILYGFLRLESRKYMPNMYKVVALLASNEALENCRCQGEVASKKAANSAISLDLFE